MSVDFVPGDKIRITGAGNTAAALQISVRGRYDDGGKLNVLSQHAATTDRTESSTDITADVFLKPGLVTSAVVTGPAGIKRGQVYMRLNVVDGTDRVRGELAAGYVYEGHSLPLGEHIEPGPGGGEGILTIEALASDVAPVAITFTAAATNAFRKLLGWAWYYNASADAATRVLNTEVRRPLGALPTGFATAGASDVFEVGGPTLTLSEEGTQYVKLEGTTSFVSLDDNATIALGSTAVPGPFLIGEGDPMTIIFTPSAANANDRHSLYVLYEEWLVI